MKKMNKFIMAVILFLSGFTAYAYDFEVGGIYYNITSETDLECEVTYKGYYNQSSYSGNMAIPSTVEYNGKKYSVTAIGSSAFESCSGLKAITIPNSVTAIRSSAFESCSSLKSITIPNSVTTIGSYAFARSGLKSVIIGTSVQSIGSEAFGSSLNKLILLPNTPPSGLYDAFSDNIKMTYVANGNYSNKKNLGTIKRLDYLSSMFDVDGIRYVPVSPSEKTCTAIDCTYSPEVKNIVIGPTVNYSGVEMKVLELNPYLLSGNDMIESIDISVAIDNIPANFANGCTQLHEINIPSDITSIGEGSFYNCSSLPSITLPEKLATIGEDAFYGSGLESIVIPSTTTDIADGAFYQCYALTRFEAQNGEEDLQLGCGKHYDYKDGFGMFAQSPLKEVKIGRNLVYKTSSYYGYSPFYCNMILETVELTDIHTEIFTNEFYGCTALKKVSIGDGVTKIGEGSFYNCSSLSSITLPKKLTTIGEDAFYGTGLESVVIPSATTSIANGAFYQCKALTRFEVQNGEEDLQLGYGKYNGYKDGFGMFAQSPLKEVKIGRNLMYETDSYYGYSPFYRNTTLETVELTDIPTEVFTNEFYGCSALKKVSIGDGVTKIGDYAFSGCSSLESFSFGASVESIGDEAFSDCTAMTKLYAEPETPPTCGTQALDDINKWNCTLYVPEGATDDYQGANQWKEFFFIENHDFANGIGNITVTPSKDAVFRIYDLNGVLIRTTQTKPDFNGLPKGIYIVNGKKVYIK